MKRMTTQPAVCTRAFTLLELLVVMAIIGLLAGMLYPFVGKSMARARASYCANNLRQLGIAVHAYAGDYNQRLPLAEPVPTNPIDPANPLPRIRDLLAPYVANSAAIFKCPEDKTRFVPEGASYEWTSPNPNGFGIGFGGQVLSDAMQVFYIFRPNPKDAAIMYDFENVHLDRGGNGSKNVLFADGHVIQL